MLALIVTLITITAILLVLVVLAQNSKGGGLSSQFGGSGSSQLMGVKRTTDLLEKITINLINKPDYQGTRKRLLQQSKY
jgi:preprotein translocase subunit SecG